MATEDNKERNLRANYAIAVCQFKLLCERKLSKPNQGPLIIVLYKNIVLCAKIMCAIHAYNIDDQGHLTLVAQHV